MPRKRAPSEIFFEFLEFKAVDEAQGTFSGYLAVKNNVDEGRDRVKDGAFLRTLNAWGEKMARSDWMPILWQHIPEDPIGGFTLMVEDPKGLYVEGFLDMDIEQGRRAYSGLKKRYIRGLSMGYQTIKAAPAEGGIRDLLEVKLWEGSVVTFPMNEEAGVEDIKSHSEVMQGMKKTNVKAIASMDGLGYALEDVTWAVGNAIREIEKVPDEYDPDWLRSRYWKAATYGAFAIAEDSKSAGQIYKVSYTLGDDGIVALGTLEPVQIAYVSMTKAIESLQGHGLSVEEAKHLLSVLRKRVEGRDVLVKAVGSLAEQKAGRRNSAADLSHIHGAMKALTALMDSPDMVPMMEHISTTMRPDDLGPALIKACGLLDENQQAALLSALQPKDSGAKSQPAPGAAATATHAEGDKGAHSEGGPADLPGGTPEDIEGKAREVLAILQKAAGPTADPDADALALLRRAAGN